MRDEVSEAVAIHVFEMTERTMVRRGSSGAKGEGCLVRVGHVEDVRTEDRDGDHARARRVDRVRSLPGLMSISPGTGMGPVVSRNAKSMSSDVNQFGALAKWSARSNPKSGTALSLKGHGATWRTTESSAR